MVAGNLQTLAVLAGTSYFPNLENTILFLEEDEEIAAPNFRRFLTQLANQKGFKMVRGVAFGRFASSIKMTEEQFVNCIYDIFGDIHIPILAGLDFGHTDPMFTIPIGGTAYINTGTNTLVFNQ